MARQPARTPMAARGGTAARTSDCGNGALGNSLPRERWMRRGRRGAERPRAARRARPLKAGNALVTRCGVRALLAQDHGLVAAVDRARRRLETERGALREAEPWRSGPTRRRQAHWGDTRVHGRSFALPLTPQRTIALIVPGSKRFFGRRSSSPGDSYTS